MPPKSIGLYRENNEVAGLNALAKNLVTEPVSPGTTECIYKQYMPALEEIPVS